MHVASTLQPSDLVGCPDTIPVDLWRHSFPSPEMVGSAASLLPRAKSWGVWDTARPGVDWFAHQAPEGPRYRLVVAPGVLSVTQVNPARAEAAAERAVARRNARVMLETVDLLLPDSLSDAESVEAAALVAVEAGLVSWDQVQAAADRVQLLEEALSRLAREAAVLPARITTWSRRSRARMRKVLAQLDYAPLFNVDALGYDLSLGYAGQALPAMGTLTYPGDWQAVVPNSRVCKAHVDALKKRFRRRYGRPLIGTWKREFQRRGAPHYHFLFVPPADDRAGFRTWLSVTWADIVGAKKCDGIPTTNCCEYHRHLASGTGVDFAEGTRMTDPARLATYFSKHGLYGAKDYQNDPPEGWAEAGTVGRFWGVWGLDKALGAVEVDADVAIAAARTMRRWFRAQGRTCSRPVWRKVTSEMLDTTTGELVAAFRWRKRNSTSRYRLMPGTLGFLVLNDAPAFTATLSRYLSQIAAAPPAG